MDKEEADSMPSHQSAGVEVESCTAQPAAEAPLQGTGAWLGMHGSKQAMQDYEVVQIRMMTTWHAAPFSEALVSSSEEGMGVGMNGITQHGTHHQKPLRMHMPVRVLSYNSGSLNGVRHGTRK